jgi:hypothetical protein
MKTLHVFRQAYLEDLYLKLFESVEQIEEYRGGSFSDSAEHTLASAIRAGDPPVLVTEQGHLVDLEVANAVAIHHWLPNLSDVQARDTRLWACLTHVVFPDYTRTRWPIPRELEKARRSVADHWFVRGRGLASLRRNAIARLWWAARLTHKPWEVPEFGSFEQRDPYAYLRVLFSNQDIYQGLLERTYGSSRTVMVPVLEVIRRRGQGASSKFVTELTKEVNLMCGYRELATMHPARVLEIVEKVAVYCPA